MSRCQYQNMSLANEAAVLERKMFGDFVALYINTNNVIH
jgi:hypothetical protein